MEEPASVGDHQTDFDQPSTLAIPRWSNLKPTYGILKELASGGNKSDTIALHGGIPPPEAFPLTAITVSLNDGTSISIPTEMAQSQYNISSTGYPKLLQWIQGHVRTIHRPPCLNGGITHQSVVTGSSSQALNIVTALFLNPGDTILMEEYTYPHYLECAILANNLKPISVPIDHQGIVPEKYEAILQDIHNRGAPMPKLLYTIPTGHNPTGANTPPGRIQEIYRICRRFDVFIVEDGPYDYLDLSLQGLPKNRFSYLHIDVDGRVIRLDSFAKCLAPGFRCGWATAAPPVADRIAMGQNAVSIGAPMISQAIIAEMLDHWGDKGLHEHLFRVQKEYRKRLDALVQAADIHLRGLAEFNIPSHGMFLWLKCCTKSPVDTIDLMEEFKEEGVVVVPGRTAAVAETSDVACPFVRVSFSYASAEQLEEGVKRIATVLSRY